MATLSQAMDFVHQVKHAGDGHIFNDFSEILKKFRRRTIDSSTVVATLEKLLHTQPDLLDAFKTFIPANYSAAATTSAAAAAEYSDLRACVDFLNRVGTRFADDGVYRKFLDCVSSYSSGESTVFEVCDKVVRLFGKNHDLVEEFRCFLPESYVQESCKKRNVGVDCNQEFRPQPPRKKRNFSLGHRIDQETAVAPPRRLSTRRTRNSIHVKEGKTEEEISESLPRKQQRIISNNERTDFDMEDSLFEVDVQIGNLTSTYMNAMKLARRLCSGGLSPADVRLDEQFTPLNLVCIRKLYSKFFDSDENRGCAILELIEVLMEKKEALERSRVKIEARWNKIRQSRLPIR